MKRWTFHITTALSLLLMLATVALWVDTQWYDARGSIPVPKFEKYITLDSTPNGIGVELSNHEPVFANWERWERWKHITSLRSGFIKIPPLTATSNSDPDVSNAGAQFTDFDWPIKEFRFVLPHWFLALIFAVLPAIWLYKRNKRRNLPDNPCLSCGYDLTGNESGECPECGVVQTVR